jgi:GcrA cell cycle regulator
MESTNWTPEHSAALREYQARGMSYSEIADAINAKFKTSYSRCAAIGRAKRLGLAGPDRPGNRRKSLPRAKARRRRKLRKRQASASLRADAGFRSGGAGQTPLCRDRAAPSCACRSLIR